MYPDGKAHGETAIIIKSSIKHYEIDKYQRDFLQATSVMIETWNGCIIISAVFSPPKHVIKSEQYIKFLEILDNPFIAAGNYNAKHTQWGSRLISSRGRELLKAIDTINLSTVSIGEPTYWTTDSKKILDLLDFGITMGIPKNSCSTESCLGLSSDNSPVIITLTSKVITKCTLHNAKTDRSYFRESLTTSLNNSIPLKTENDITCAVENLKV